MEEQNKDFPFVTCKFCKQYVGGTVCTEENHTNCYCWITRPDAPPLGKAQAEWGERNPDLAAKLAGC